MAAPLPRVLVGGNSAGHPREHVGVSSPASASAFDTNGDGFPADFDAHGDGFLQFPLLRPGKQKAGHAFKQQRYAIFFIVTRFGAFPGWQSEKRGLPELPNMRSPRPKLLIWRRARLVTVTFNIHRWITTTEDKL